MGFNISQRASLWRTSDAYVSIDAPKAVRLTVGESNGFVITEWTTGERHHIQAEAHTRNRSPGDAEHYMPDGRDLQPLFAASTVGSYQDLAAIYNIRATDKDALTPEIHRLANRVTAGKSGVETARALYNWVVKNIRYVALYVNAADGWIPHDAATVLHNRFGDCKDHVVLLQALLSVKGRLTTGDG